MPNMASMKMWTIPYPLQVVLKLIRNSRPFDGFNSLIMVEFNSEFDETPPCGIFKS